MRHIPHLVGTSRGPGFHRLAADFSTVLGGQRARVPLRQGSRHPVDHLRVVHRFLRRSALPPHPPVHLGRPCGRRDLARLERSRGAGKLAEKRWLVHPVAALRLPQHPDSHQPHPARRRVPLTSFTNTTRNLPSSAAKTCLRVEYPHTADLRSLRSYVPLLDSPGWECHALASVIQCTL